MSLIVAGSTQSLQVVLSAAVATSQLALSASWADQGGSLGALSIASNGTTAVTVVPAPTGTTGRVVGSLSICNTDTAVATVTLNRVISGASTRLLKVTLGIGYQLIYGAGRWEVLDASGVLQSTGGGGGVTLANTSPWTKNQYVAPVALTSGTTVAIDASLSNNFKLTMAGACKLSNPTNLAEGMVLNFAIDQDATGSRALTFDTLFKPASGAWPTWVTTAGAKSFISGYYDGTVIRCNASTGY